MQDTPSEGYTYVITIQGAQALQQAKQIRGQLVAELAGAEKQLSQAVAGTLDIISSQTRRLSYNKGRLLEVTKVADEFGKAWLRTTGLITAASEGTFDAFVADAKQAYDEVAGHSIFAEMYYAIKRYYSQITAASEGVFDPLVQEATAAAKGVTQAIEGITDKQGKLRFPPGAALQGVSLAGREATPAQIDKYNKGMLQFNDVMTGIPLASAAAQASLKDQGYAVAETTGFWEQFTDQLNLATIQYFGIRRLGYGFEQFGAQLARAGQRNVSMLTDWAQAYIEFNRMSTLAAAAMEMTADEQRMLEETVLNNIEAMRLFDPEETINGLRIWAAGTGQVVHSQDQLNTMLEQTQDIQMLAALGNVQLGETMEYVGAAVAEYGLSLDDTDRIARVFNFTAAKTFAEIADMGNAFKLVGPEAASFGISLEETSAALGLLSDRNIKGTMAGRAFRQMLIQLSKPTQQHTDLLNDALGLNKELGETWQDLVFPEGEFIGLASYIDLVAAATENMGQQQRNTLLATMATANELPSLKSLIEAQTLARKEGINVIRAWTKWMVGGADEEVEAFARLMEKTRGVEIDTATDMYTLWAQQSELYYDSEAARAMELERRWKAMKIGLGEIVLVEGAPIIEDLLGLLEKIVKFARENPGLVMGFMTAAVVELILGNLIAVSGQLLGVVANILILRGAFAGFGGAVGTFQTAVAQFTLAATGKKVPRIPAEGLGVLGIVSRLAAVFAAIAITDQPSREQKVYEDLLETMRDLDTTVEQWNAIFGAGFEWTQVIGPYDYGRAYRLTGMVEGEEVVLDVRGVLELLEGMKLLTDEQQEFLDELRTHPVLDVEIDGTVDPYIEELLASIDSGSVWEIDVQLATALTPEEIAAIDLFDTMNQELADLEEKYGQLARDRHKRLWDQLKDDYANYQDDIISTTNKQHLKEEDAYRKHMQKLADIRRKTQEQMEEELIRLGERIDEVWTRAAERIAEAETESNAKIEESRADHLKKLRRMEEDHRDNLLDLAIRRDAYGIWQATREYKKRVDRENEDFQEKQSRLREEGRNRIEEIKRQAAREEAELRRAYTRRMAELERQLKRQIEAQKRSAERARKERVRANKRELDELERKYKRQRAERITAFNKEIRDLYEKFRTEYLEMQRAKTIEIAMLRGMYTQQLYDLQGYLRERLDLVDLYLQEEKRLWEGYSPYPQAPAPTPPPPVEPPYPPGVPTPTGLYNTPVTTPTVVVEGRVGVTVDVTGAELPAEAGEALAEGFDQLFETVLRRLEVRYV